MRGRAIPVVFLGLLGLLAGTAPTDGQAGGAITYLVQDSDQGVAWPGARPEVAPELDLSGDRSPLRVYQGPTLTWIVPEGDSVALRNAVMILDRNAPLRPGPDDIMVRGWQEPTAPFDTFDLDLARGSLDRRVAGRPARHYRLHATLWNSGPGATVGQRLAFTAHFWVLVDVPHSWAPFGFGARALTSLAPAFRDALDRELADLGLVAMAVTRSEYTEDRDRAPSVRVQAFTITAIEASDPPPPVGPVIDHSVLTGLDRRVRRAPGATCTAVAAGELPDEVRGVEEGARRAVLARVNDRCGSPELWFGLVEDRLRAEPADFCARVAAARDPADLAEAVFTAAQQSAFSEFLTDVDRQRFHADLQRFCRSRALRD